MSKHSFTHYIFALIFCGVFGAALPGSVSAQTPSATYTALYKFGTNAHDPIQPQGPQFVVQGRDGNIYSASTNGGMTNSGAVFKVTPSGTLTVVSSLGNPGNNPFGGLTLGTDGNFYGTTKLNGEGPGTAFKVSPSGVETGLHIFGNGSDGACPYAAPIQATDGNHYGTTTTVCGFGSVSKVYKLSSAGVLTTIYSFDDGSNVTAPLVQGTDGNFYGVTAGGGTNPNGSVFKITPSGTLTVLHAFAGTDGSAPYGGLIQASDGNYYGVTSLGGTANAGVIYKITASGTFTPLHSLNGTTNGSGPGGSLIQATDGKLYGAAYAGGSSSLGTIFSITTSGTFSVLVNFNGTNGANPNSPLRQNTNGVLYGDTYSGGDLSMCGSGCGVFYSLNVGLGPFVSLVTTSGKVGSNVGILGQGFSSSSVVKFNGVKATTVTASGTHFLLATVPAGATDGKVTVTTGTTTLTSAQKYIVHNSWSSGAVMPTGVQWPMTGTIGNKIYVVGGYTSSVGVTDNQIYTPSTNTWSTGAPIPTATAQGATAVVNNILYIFGGSDNGGGTVTNAVYAYNPTTNSWSTKMAMPTARCSAVAVVEKGIVYVIGGFNSGNRLGTVESYNPTTDKWTTEASLLHGKTEISAGLIGSTIVAADGFTSSADTGDNEGYNATKNTWTALTPDPTARNGSCAGVVNGVLYAATGNASNNNPLSVNESFNLTANKWTSLAVPPQSTTDPGAAVSGGQLYCFGGSSVALAFSGTIYNNVQVYQP